MGVCRAVLFAVTESRQVMGFGHAVVEAEYRVRRTVTLETSPHIASVGLYLSPQDVNGQGGGSTPTTRQYLQGTQVTVTLPAGNVGGHPFKQWRIGGIDYPLGQLAATFDVTGDLRATALFYVHTVGTFTGFGAGCVGSTGPDVHTGFGRPELGEAIMWVLTGGAVSAPAVLVLGASNTNWLGVPLPLALPDAPGCNLYVSMDVSFPTVTGSGGVAQFPVTVPNVPSLIGGHVYTQFGCVDLGTNQLGVTLSNGLDTLIGGSR